MGRNYLIFLAGVAGFEPTNAGIKIRCLNHLATPLYFGVGLVFAKVWETSPQIPAQKSKRKSVFIFGAGDGNRTHDLKDHNLAL